MKPIPSVPRLDPVRATELSSRFERVSVLVVGDLMLDRFVWGQVTRISPEAPIPIVRLERETTCPGGAGNVARNIVSLGGRAEPVGLRGDDREGEELVRVCRENGIPGEGLVPAPGRPTTLKMRVVAHHQHVVRVDREEDGPPGPGIVRALLDRSLERLEGAAALIVSDYDKGCITPELLSGLLPEAARRGLPVVIDPKVRLFDHYRPATVITPNAREAMEATGLGGRTDEEFIAIGRRLRERAGCGHLLITRGEKGMLLLGPEGEARAIPTVARDVFDVSGAGDTVVATLALALGAGATVEEGVVLSNHAAGIVVGKVGTAAPSREELLRACGAARGGAPRAPDSRSPG
ncbi:MAG: D-glycero-beta-D-manno-heptose-7-phosphate kinase [Acidobacteriota bacterium]